MASLASQAVSAAYEQLLHVDRDGGGNTTTLVDVKDGDNGTTFALKLAQYHAEIRGTTGTGATGAGKLNLSTAELTVVDNDVLGRIDFLAPLESSGTDAILAGASIWGEAEDTFAADNNETALVFATNTSAAATERMRIDASGKVGIGVAPGGSSWSGAGGLLHIYNSSDAAIILEDSSTAQENVFATDGNGLYIDSNGHATAANNKIIFRTEESSASFSPSNRMVIAAAGDVTVSTGNLVIGTSGKGIDFTPDGAQAGVSSELLDDYEEGTWTPTLTNITIGNGTTTATYTKIGRLVHIMCKVVFGSTTSVGGQMDIRNLPFATPSNTMPVSCYFYEHNVNYYPGFAYTITNVIYFRGVSNDPATATVPFTWGTSDQVYFMATYED